MSEAEAAIEAIRQSAGGVGLHTTRTRVSRRHVAVARTVALHARRRYLDLASGLPDSESSCLNFFLSLRELVVCFSRFTPLN